MTSAIFDTTSRDGKTTAEDAMRLSMGAAYVKPHVFSVAADAYYRFSRSDALTTSSSQTYSRTVTGQATRTVETRESRTGASGAGVDFAVGAEVYLGPGAALQAGYARFADARARRAPTLDALHEAYRDVQMITAGVTFAPGIFETTVGGALLLESGDIYVRDLYSVAPQPDQLQPLVVSKHVEGQTFMFLLSGAISREKAEGQVRDRAQQVVPGANLVP